MKIKQALEMKEGIYHGCSPRHYHSSQMSTAVNDAGVEYRVPSKSMLSSFAEDPAKWLTNPPFKKSSAMTEGSLLDDMLLTPADLHENFLVKPEDAPRRPTPQQLKAEKKSETALKSITFWNNFDKKAEGREVISAQQMINAKLGVKNLKNHPICSEMIKQSHNQTVVIAKYRGHLVKGMFDLFPQDGSDFDDSIIDLKRTSAFTPQSFKAIIRNFKYHWQAALYRWLVMQATGQDRKIWRFMLSDSETPFNCGVLRMHEDDIARGHREVFAALDRYIDCVEKQEFPSPYDLSSREELVLKSFSDAFND